MDRWIDSVAESCRKLPASLSFSLRVECIIEQAQIKFHSRHLRFERIISKWVELCHSWHFASLFRCERAIYPFKKTRIQPTIAVNKGALKFGWTMADLVVSWKHTFLGGPLWEHDPSGPTHLGRLKPPQIAIIAINNCLNPRSLRTHFIACGPLFDQP